MEQFYHKIRKDTFFTEFLHLRPLFHKKKIFSCKSDSFNIMTNFRKILTNYRTNLLQSERVQKFIINQLGIHLCTGVSQSQLTMIFDNTCIHLTNIMPQASSITQKALAPLQKQFVSTCLTKMRGKTTTFQSINKKTKRNRTQISWQVIKKKC